MSQAQLVQHIPSSSLPLELGGTQPPHDHHAWLLHCLKVQEYNMLLPVRDRVTLCSNIHMVDVFFLLIHVFERDIIFYLITMD